MLPNEAPDKTFFSFYFFLQHRWKRCKRKNQPSTMQRIFNARQRSHLCRSAFYKYHSKGFWEPFLMLFCFLGPLRKGVNASGIRLITGAGGGPRWVIWHGIGLNRIVVLKA